MRRVRMLSATMVLAVALAAAAERSGADETPRLVAQLGHNLSVTGVEFTIFGGNASPAILLSCANISACFSAFSNSRTLPGQA